MGVKKRYCEHCDGVNSGGFYDDICVIQELKEYQKYLFEESKNFDGNYGCQVPAKVFKEAEEKYGEPFGGGNYSDFAICEALAEQRDEQKRSEIVEEILSDDVNICR